MSTSTYDTFNARYLSYQEVADSFVMTSSHFNKLIKNNHTLLMGPRGCGKTTLLKMLTIPALGRWDANTGSKIKSSIPFYSVYIPTDIQWKRQLDELVKEFPKDEKFPALISNAAVTINILISLCKTFSFIISDLELTNQKNEFVEKEIELSKALILGWKMKGKIIPSLSSIESALLQIISDLNAKIKRTIFLKKVFTDFDEIVFCDFMELVKIGCKKFETIFNLKDTSRWALCFDELEIAPDWLQYQLLGYLRSSDQKFLFKLTTAPIIKLYNEIKEKFSINATEDNDYNVVRIWNSNHSLLDEWFEFCNEISRLRVTKKFTNIKYIDEIVGSSDLDLAIIASNSWSLGEFKKNIYAHGSPTWRIFVELSKIDSSFKKFLENKGINPNNPIPKDISQRDEVFRKMRQLAIYRYQFRKDDSSRRSRKVVPLYFGAKRLFEICDGNPRFLIGLIDELLENSDSGNRIAGPLTINDQSRIITKISDRYISVLASYPGGTVVINNKDKNIKELIDEIGDYIHDKLVSDDFTIDPTTSFKIDEEINGKLVNLLELALYLGAIVYLDGKEAVSEKGVVNKKFRLNYVLAPYFRILIREYKDIRLSSILKKSSKDTSQLSITDPQ